MASFCFSSNLILQDYLKRNVSDSVLDDETEKLERSLIFFRDQISKKKINSITDLQTYIIVKERLDETEDYLDSNSELDRMSRENNSIDISLIDSNKRTILAYATERFYSAGMWLIFLTRIITDSR
jgi:hypothetical protein